MAALENPRHERYAQELAKGASQAEALRSAGYADNRSAASRLSTKVNIQQRVAELQKQGAVKTLITIERLTQMLLEDRELARENVQAGAAVAATEKLGKLHGMFVERTESVNFHHDISNSPPSEAEWDEAHSTH